MTVKSKADATGRIRERAHALWEQEGYPDGRAMDHWLAAETEVSKEINGSKARSAPRARRVTTKPAAEAKIAPAAKPAARKKPAKKAVRKRTNGK